MEKRFWGEQIDQLAANQLELDAAKHTVFMMGSDADHVEDLDEIAEQLEEGGSSLMTFNEAVDVVKDHIGRVKLPDGFRLVGMRPIDSTEPRTYGVVDLRAAGYQ